MTPRCEERLQGVHPDLVAVVRRAAEVSPIDFIVTEGLRTEERQAELVKTGASRTMNSRHLTGHAVDLAVIVDGKANWDWKQYEDLSAYMKSAADDLGIRIIWGGDWATFKDGPHYELDRRLYA